jgi:hypothetical protein
VSNGDWQELRTLEDALGLPAPGDRNDEHVRYRVFEDALPHLHREDVLVAFVAALANDPDRSMASGVAGLILLPGAAAELAAATERAVSDSAWVRQRSSELAIYERLVPFGAQGFESELADASGWLEERLAADSQSPKVLGFLSLHAKRRRARHEADGRLKILNATM